MTATALFGATDAHRSVFAGVDVCREAALALPGGVRPPMFDDDFWDFTEVVGLPNQLAKVNRRFNFTPIINVDWRLVAKEQIMAMLAPRHGAVAPLPRPYRTPLHLATAFGRLAELTRFLNWLTGQGLASLADIDGQRCEAYLAHRRYVRDENDVVVGELSPATRRAAAQTIVDLVNHRELFTLDRVSAHLRPWGGAAPSAVAEMPCGTGQNKTAPVHDSVLQPMLAAAGYLVSVLGPHAIELSAQVRDADQRWSVRSGEHVAISRLPTNEIARLLADYERRGEPLPLLPEHNVAKRLAAGWSPQDPLTSIALGLLARQAGFTQFLRGWIPHLREQIEATLRVVGAQKPFGRDAQSIDSADAKTTIAWTLPLDRMQAVALVGIVRTAAIITVAAVSGMRSSELMELQIGCCRPPEQFAPRAGALPAGQQSRQGTAAGRARRRMGRHRTGLPGRRTPRAPPRQRPTRAAPAWPVRVRRPLQVVPQLGERPSRATSRTRPAPRGQDHAADAAQDAGDRTRLPPGWDPRRQDPPQACRRGHHRGLRLPPRRSPSRAARRGQQARE